MLARDGVARRLARICPHIGALHVESAVVYPLRDNSAWSEKLGWTAETTLANEVQRLARERAAGIFYCCWYRERVSDIVADVV